MAWGRVGLGLRVLDLSFRVMKVHEQEAMPHAVVRLSQGTSQKALQRLLLAC